MLYPSINETRQKVDSRYTLVILAAKRARDIIDGVPVLTEDCDNDKPVSEAAYEINERLITYRRPEEQPEAVEAEAEEAVEAASEESQEAPEAAAEEAAAEAQTE